MSKASLISQKLGFDGGLEVFLAFKVWVLMLCLGESVFGECLKVDEFG